MDSLTLDNSESLQHQRCENISVLRIQGSPLKRAQLLGQYFKKNKQSSTILDYFSEKVTKGLQIIPAFLWVFDRWSDIKLKKYPLYKELEVWAQEADYDLRSLKRAILAPDLGAFSTLLEHIKVPSFACSSFVTVNESQHLIGRNLDFSGVGVFDKKPAVYVHIPESDDEIAHLSISTEDLFFASITGLNKEGIYLSVHQNYTRDHKLKGRPLIFIGEEVLRKAHSIEEALTLLEKNRPLGLWTFNVTDFKSGESAIVEISSTLFRVRKGRHLTRANHLMEEDTREMATYSKKWNSKLRQDKLEKKLLEFQKQTVIPQEMKDLLAEGLSSENWDMCPSESIIRPGTIQTVYILAKNWEEAELYVSNDAAPTASGSFVKFKINDFWKREITIPFQKEILNTNEESRARDLQWTAAYAAYDNSTDHCLAVQKLEGLNSSTASLFRLAHLILLDDLDRAEEVVNAGLCDVAPAHLLESFRVLSVQLFNLKGDFLRATTLANDLTTNELLDLKHLNTLNKLTLYSQSKKKKCIIKDIDYFSGAVNFL